MHRGQGPAFPTGVQQLMPSETKEQGKELDPFPSDTLRWTRYPPARGSGSTGHLLLHFHWKTSRSLSQISIFIILSDSCGRDACSEGPAQRRAWVHSAGPFSVYELPASIRQFPQLGELSDWTWQLSITEIRKLKQLPSNVLAVTNCPHAL